MKHSKSTGLNESEPTDNWAMNEKNQETPFALLPSVILLFLWRSPITITRAVWAVIISSFDRFAFWFVSHIPIECVKAIFPFCANRDASASIVVPRCIKRIVATPLHVFPRAIRWRLALTVTGIFTCDSFVTPAAATLEFSNVCLVCFPNAATVAAAQPKRPQSAFSFMLNPETALCSAEHRNCSNSESC